MCVYYAAYDKCCSTQLIDGDGTINVSGIESFMKEVKLGECGLSYAVVSIMGPQSSGVFSILHCLLTYITCEKPCLKGCLVWFGQARAHS